MSSLTPDGEILADLSVRADHGESDLSATPSPSARLAPPSDNDGDGTRALRGGERSWAIFVRNRTAMAGLCGIVALVLIAVVGPQVYTQSATDADIFNLTNNAWPSGAHLLGTDKDGIDILARLMVGTRVSLTVALFAEVLNVLLGVPIGLAAGYYGGAIDFTLSRIADVLFAFPGLLLAILVTGVFGPVVGDAAGG